MTNAYAITPELILETLPLAIFTVDHRLCITYFNGGIENLLGVSRNEALGELYSDILSVTFATGTCPLCTAVETGNSCFDVSAIITNSVTQQFKVQVSTSPLRDTKDTIIGSVAVLQPVGLDLSDNPSMQHAVQVCEVQSIITALRRNNNNRTAAARDLGIHKSTFFRKIKKMGIDLPHIDGRFRNKPS